MPADVDETRRPGEKPIDYVARVAHDKAMAVVAKLGFGATGDVVVLAADTTVDVDGEILGKPADDDDARRMLRLLSGRTPPGPHGGRRLADHRPADGDGHHRRHVRRARRRRRSTGTSSTGEHLDKAGAYGIQGAAGALVERIDGSPTNVIGLPLAETVAVLRACGVRCGSVTRR